MSNIDDQVSDIRERVARIETRIGYLQRAMDKHAETMKSGGNVVIPVALVVTVLEIVKAVIERIA